MCAVLILSANKTKVDADAARFRTNTFIYIPFQSEQFEPIGRFNSFQRTSMMMAGGFLLAIAIEKCDLHRRLAINILILMGTNPRWYI